MKRGHVLVVKGYRVMENYTVTVPAAERGGGTRERLRKVSRRYATRAAADDFCALAKQQGRDVFVRTERGNDGLSHEPPVNS